MVSEQLPLPELVHVMSSYLLLRNNKESGPFTLEEIKAMTLKAYDLIWVVGKSAAWRYPGEIADLMAFAPPVPEQLTDVYSKRQDSRKGDPDGPIPDSGTTKKPETVNRVVRENNGLRITPSRSIYVNLPAEKKPSIKTRDRIQFEPDLPVAVNPEPVYDYSDLYKKHSSSSAIISTKILWISTIALLFGAGILTGLFISDRIKFFSVAEKPTQKEELIQGNSQKEKGQQNQSVGHSVNDIENTNTRKDSAKTIRSIPGKMATTPQKRVIKTDIDKKDSLVSPSGLLSTFTSNDSLKQSEIPKSDPLFQKIKAHPENFVDLVTGRYSTGVFGGISSFPVTLTNNSPLKLDLVVVHIDYIQNNEKIFKTESLSFNDLEPGETVTLKAPKSTRGVRINTRIQIVNSRLLDLSSSH
jgi:hypothetical protein